VFVDGAAADAEAPAWLEDTLPMVDAEGELKTVVLLGVPDSMVIV